MDEMRHTNHRKIAYVHVAVQGPDILVHQGPDIPPPRIFLKQQEINNTL
jgi:hypothetical protein